MTKQTIAAVLFDIGGVLVSLDGVPSMARLLQVAESHEEIDRLWMAAPSVVLHETGRISADEFSARIVAELGLAISAEAFMLDFAEWPKTPIPGAFQLVEAIPTSYRVAALSNTSAVHWRRIQALGLPRRFEKLYLSHEIGWLKPAREAFHAALDGLALPPEAVLFLDDGVENVNGAHALGLPSHVVKSPADTRAVLQQYGILAAPS